MNKYIKILRPDHWIKQLFILPGVLFAIILTEGSIDSTMCVRIVLGLFSVCLIASANYAINEYLDAEFDRFHPTKKNRPVVTEGINSNIVYSMWLALGVFGLGLSWYISYPFLITSALLLFMGVLYNVKPFRTKDLPILDVCSESFNNAIRLLMGWFIVSSNTVPPGSIILGYWMGGAFLMSVKRFAEYRMINDKELAGLYRKSFRYYSEKSLLISSFVYAMLSVFLCGVFLIKYRIELILFIPGFIGLFAYYLSMSFDEDSAVQKPEKLFKQTGLMILCTILSVLFIVLMLVDIPYLNILISNRLIGI